MTTYLITYDLNRPGKDYPRLYETIKSLSSAWWHHLDSTWFIVSSLPASVIRDALKTVVDSTDVVLVIKVALPWASYNLTDKASSWLKNNIN